MIVEKRRIPQESIALTIGLPGVVHGAVLNRNCNKAIEAMADYIHTCQK
jgi:hypothetical protein